jgi:hypothetical protein
MVQQPRRSIVCVWGAGIWDIVNLALDMKEEQSENFIVLVVNKYSNLLVYFCQPVRILAIFTLFHLGTLRLT